MKQIIFLFVISVFLIAGCSEQPVAPTQTSSAKAEFLKLPVNKALSSELTFSVTKEINGDKGGTIDLSKTYISLFQGKIILVSAKVEFPAGAFSGSERITVSVNSDETSVTFYPHMKFNKDVNFDLSYTDLNLGNLLSSNVDFVYVDDSGNIEYIDRDYLLLNRLLGTVAVHGAKLKHFSRYGFIKNPQN
jgi:hypothetical protein